MPEGEAERAQRLTDAAWLMTRGASLLVLGRMRELEERLLEPAARWDALRAALERFAATELREDG